VRAVGVEYPHLIYRLFGRLFAYNGIRRRTREERSKGPWLCAREPNKVPNKTIPSAIIFPNSLCSDDNCFREESIVLSCALG
jgi:hypothetical protein